MMPEDVPTALYHHHRRRARWGRVENGWVSGGEIERGGERCGNGWGLCGGENEGIERVSRHTGRSKRTVKVVKGAGVPMPLTTLLAMDL